MHRFGMLDAIVFAVACFLICASICLDRQQQLYTRYLRQVLLPPPWRDPRAACFLLIERLCSALLPSVTLSMILMVFGGERRLASDAAKPKRSPVLTRSVLTNPAHARHPRRD